MKRPPAGQGPFQRGERLTAAKLNEVVDMIRPVRAGGRVGLVGDAIVSDETDTTYMRITGRTGANYSWVEVYRTPNGTWSNTTRTGNATYDWAVERNNATVSAGQTVYEARRSPDTSEWIFDQGGGGGQFQANSSETVLMILGTYDEYKDCPDVPPSPPTVITDVCTGARGTDLCVPAYAYAVYQRCGYEWNKIGDTRTYGVWATEMNGQSFSAWRRFVIPRWGGSFDPATGLPDPDADCMGVAFLGTGAGSALTCSCPTCLSSPPEGTCLAVQFRTPERPEDPAECADAVAAMDAADAWDKTFLLPFDVLGCTAGAATDDGLFTFEWQFTDGATLSCDWGPEVFDPCDPCEHWGRLYSSITINAGSEANCGGAGVWRGEFKAREICDLICDCENGPIGAIDESLCGGCGNVTPPLFHFIVAGSVEIICCPDTLHDSAESLPLTIQDTGGTSFGFQDSTL